MIAREKRSRQRSKTMKFKHGKNFCLKDKRSVFIAPTVKIGDNVTIYESNRIEGDTVIGDGAIILPFCYIKDTVIESGAVVESSNVSGAKIGKDAKLECVILDKNVTVSEGAVLKGTAEHPVIVRKGETV